MATSAQLIFHHLDGRNPVPRQVALTDVPQDLSRIAPSLAGRQYLVVRDQLVIVEPQSRRIVAIVAGV